MRLIDADVLMKAFYKSIDDAVLHGGKIVPFQDIIQNAPTIDAVPVVRCRDCRWWTKQEKSIQGRCALTGTYPTGGWYCGNGERKDDE